MQNRILVTGSRGYIGTELVKMLRKKGYRVTGFDLGYFQKCSLENLEEYDEIQGDIREIDDKLLKNFDTIIHLAALSNDPLGDLNDDLTYSINRDGAINLAKIAKLKGVKRFIFASTQSIYGITDPTIEVSENYQKRPISTYAKAKWDAEQEILGIRSADFVCTAVRPSTVFGWGSRIRNDIIFNNLIYSGLKNGKIQVHTDGTPVRPVIHIQDLIENISLLVEFDERKVNGQAFNLGQQNLAVIEIAKIAAKCLYNLPLEISTENITDPRSYRVSFEKSILQLGINNSRTLMNGGMEIVERFNLLNPNAKEIYKNNTIRLNSLKENLSKGYLNQKLQWQN